MLINKHRYFSFILLIILTASIISGCSALPFSDDTVASYSKSMDYHDGFTILQLTDIHWNTGTQIGGDNYGAKQYLSKVIDEVKAHAGNIDLIEITGDTFMLANASEITSFIDYMTSLNIPYAILWGNHDREGLYHPNWISNQFLNAPNSLYTEVDKDNVHNRSNYIINLLKDGHPVWQIANIDSGASYRDEALDIGLTYDFIRQDQLEWLSAMHSAVPGNVPVICYYHIPQADNDLAIEAIQNGASDYKSKFFRLESFAASDYAPSTEAIFLANNVKAAFMGHAHGNDWTFTTPSGITYGLGVKTGNELYYRKVSTDYTSAGFEFDDDFDLIGASLLTLNNTDGDFSLEHLYLNERDEGDFVMWVEY